MAEEAQSPSNTRPITALSRDAQAVLLLPGFDQGTGMVPRPSERDKEPGFPSEFPGSFSMLARGSTEPCCPPQPSLLPSLNGTYGGTWAVPFCPPKAFRVLTG